MRTSRLLAGAITLFSALTIIASIGAVKTAKGEAAHIMGIQPLSDSQLANAKGGSGMCCEVQGGATCGPWTPPPTCTPDCSGTTYGSVIGPSNNDACVSTYRSVGCVMASGWCVQYKTAKCIIAAGACVGSADGSTAWWGSRATCDGQPGSSNCWF